MLDIKQFIKQEDYEGIYRNRCLQKEKKTRKKESLPWIVSNIVFNSYMYSGTCAIRHLSFPTPCDIRQKLMVPKYFS